jgi:peptidoglycan/LPS O-acetylase OafA/YrhL
VLAPLQILGPHDSAPPWLWLLYFSPFVRAFEFFAGALTAQVVISTSTSRSDGMPLAAVCAIAYCAAAILLGPPWSIATLTGALMPNFIFAPAIVVILITVSLRDTMLTRILSSKLLVDVGEISYSVYLLQALVFVAVSNSFAGAGTIGAVAKAAYAILIVTALGYGCFNLFESPMRHWIRSFTGRRAGAPRQARSPVL